MSHMNIHLFPIQSSLSVAFTRLKIWFDPAQDGSPYELSKPYTSERMKKRYPFFSKKLSMRM